MARSNVITAEGAVRLRNELANLWKRVRPEVTRALAAAAAEGDRSENAEYIYRKKQLREIDRRLRYLQKRVIEMQVVDRLPGNREKVFFGAWVTLIDSDNSKRGYRIVGSDEFDQAPEYISVDSPMAKALLGKTVGAELVVRIEDGTKQYSIAAIEYR